MENEKLQKFLEKIRNEQIGRGEKTQNKMSVVVSNTRAVVPEGETVQEKNIASNGRKRGKKQYIYEDKSRRTKNTRVYRVGEGKWEVVVSGASVHYYDAAENKMRRIDNTLEYKSDKRGDRDFSGFENKYNSFKVRFAESSANSDLMRVEKDGYEIYFKPLAQDFSVCSSGVLNRGCRQVRATVGTQSNSNDTLVSEIGYKELYDGVNFDYEIKPSSIKENITIKTRKDSYNFVFKVFLRGLDIQTTEDGKEVRFVARQPLMDTHEGDAVFTMPAAYMYDHSGNKSYEIGYSVEATGEGEYILKVTPSEIWLNDESRVFPVVIDPTLFIKDDSDMIYRIVTNYSDYSPASDFYYSNSGYIQLGYLKGSASGGESIFGETELYIGFKNADRILNGLVNSATLIIPMPIRAGVAWGVPDVDCTDGFYEVYGVIDGPEWMDGTINWGTRPNTGSDVLAFAKPVQNEAGNYSLQLNITSALTSKYSGFVVKASQKCIEFTKGVWQNSTYIPIEDNKGLVEVTISYSEKDQIRGGKTIEQPCNRAGTGAIDLFTGDIAFVHEDLNLDGVQFPINISHIYNSRFIASDEDSTYQCGKGWRLNFMQTLKEKQEVIGSFNEDSAFKCYEYTDVSGYRHELTTRYYKTIQSDDGTRNYKIYGSYREITKETPKDWDGTEIGNGTYTLTTVGGKYVLTDEAGNKLKFAATGRLESIEKPETATHSSFKMSIVYGNGYIDLTDANNRTVRLEYTANRLVSIKYNNEVVRSYTYQTINSAMCLKTIVTSSGTSAFEYDENGCLCRVTDPTGYTLEYKTDVNKNSVCNGYRVKTKIQKISYNADEQASGIAGLYEQILEDVTITYHAAFCAEAGGRFNGFYYSMPMYNMTKVENNAGAIQYYSFSPAGALLTVFDDKLNQEVSYFSSKFTAIDEAERWGKTETTQISASVLGTAQVCGSMSSRSPIYSNSMKQCQHLCGQYSNLSAGGYVFTAIISGNVVPGQTFNSLSDEEAQDASYVVLKVIRHLSEGKTDEQFVRANPSCGSGMSEQVVSLPFLVDEDVLSVDLYVEIRNHPDSITVPYWELLPAAKATEVVARDKDDSVTKVFSGKNKTEVKSDLTKRDDCTKQRKITRSGADKSVETKIKYASKTSERVIEEDDGISLVRKYTYDGYGNIKSEEVWDGVYFKSNKNNLDDISKRMRREYSYDHSDAKLNHNALRSETDENGNQTTYDYEPLTGFIKRTILPGTAQNIDYAYNGIEGLLKEIKAVENSGQYVEETANTFWYNQGYLTKVSHAGCEYGFIYDGFGRIKEVTIGGKTVIKSSYVDFGEDIDGVEGAVSKTSTAYYNEKDAAMLLCGAELCGRAVCGQASDSAVSQGLLCGQVLCGQAVVGPSGRKNVGAYCGDVYCGQRYSESRGGWLSELYVSYYDKHGDLIKVRRAVGREPGDPLGENDDYVTITELNENQKHTKTYTVGETKYVYSYDRITGEMLESAEYEGESQKIRFVNAGKDQFGRVNEIDFTIDNDNDMRYTYVYKSEYEDSVSAVILPSGKNSTVETDCFGRLTERKINTEKEIVNTYGYINGTGGTTPLVDNEKMTAGGITETYKYAYDANNNITQVRSGSGSLLVSYQYDGLNRLIRENIVGGNTTVYKYDKDGNILFKKVFSYSEATGKTVTALLNSASGTTVNYGYGAAYNGDLLTTYNGSGALEYDNYGNPKKWFKHGASSSSLSYTLQWGDVSNLICVKDDDSGILYTYMYNNNGIRTCKVVNGKTHRYYLNGEKIIAEKVGDEYLKFYYDATGVCGFNYDNKDYYYQKNIFGDILKVYLEDGTVLAKYEYDAWGKCTVKTNVNGIANVNPFRYRGYYYDEETKLYYLNARYYDPEIGRFISPDSLDYLDPESINGLNLYVYCKNNPVMHIDPSGQAWLTILLIIGISALLGAIDGGITAAMSGQNFWLGFAAGAIGGAIGGVMTVLLPTGWGAWVGVLSRLASSAAYNFFNELFQKGTIENMDWGLFAMDLIMDAIFAVLYADYANVTGNGLAKIIGGKFVEQIGKIATTFICGTIDGIVDILQTIMYNNRQNIGKKAYQ